jgi:hypothetical protein
VSEENVIADVKPIYITMKQKFGKMPNLFGIMAHMPDVLKVFLPLYQSIMGAGTLEQKYKPGFPLSLPTAPDCTRLERFEGTSFSLAGPGLETGSRLPQGESRSKVART